MTSKSIKYIAESAPILGASGAGAQKLYQDFIYLSLKSSDTQKTYHFAAVSFLNFCLANEVEDIRDMSDVSAYETDLSLG